MLHAYYLHIPTDHELIEVTAPDPFLAETDSNWTPTETVQSLSEAMANLINKAFSMEGTGPEGKTEPPKPLEAKRETEEERAVCQQWLAEWPGE